MKQINDETLKIVIKLFIKGVCYFLNYKYFNTKEIFLIIFFILGINVNIYTQTTKRIVKQAEPQSKFSVSESKLFPQIIKSDKKQSFLVVRENGPSKKLEYLQKAVRNGVNIIWYALGSPTGYLINETGNRFYEINDRAIKKILAKTPNAFIILQVTVDISPKYHKKWCERYSSEMAVSPLGKKRISLASQIWKQAQVQGLKELTEHIKTSSYANRIIGVILSGGGGEWCDNWDTSQPALNGFRKWLKAKYKNDVASLQSAWHNKNINFETLTIPKLRELQRGDCGIFLDPRKSQRIIDYFYYYSSVTCDVVADFARAVKKASNNKLLVGMFHGYEFYPGWNKAERGLQRRRDRLFAETLKNPDIDFFLAPYCYRERHAGGVYTPQFLPSSIILNGKIALTEDDSRTLLSKLDQRYKNHAKYGDSFGKPANLEDTLEILKRNFAGIMSKPGSGIVWFALSEGLWFDHPEILKLFKAFSKIAGELIGRDKNTSEIAVIISNESMLYQKLNRSNIPFITRTAVENLNLIGAPFDYYLDTDLGNKNFPFKKYKLYIFLNSFYLSQTLKSAIKENIQTLDNTILWIFAPGYVTRNSLSVKSMSELIGMNMEAVDLPFKFGADVVITDYNNPATRGIYTNTRYGTAEEYGPVIFCKDQETQTLGWLTATLPGIPTFRKPGLCIKKFKNWTSIWSGAPNLPTSILRNIAKNAGVHIYDDHNDQIMTSKMLFACHTKYSGKRTIKFPQKCDVYDPLKNKYIGKGIKQLKIFIPGKKTVLWILK